MAEKVWVCGLGAVTAIGMNVGENYDGLLQQKSGAGYPEFLQTSHKNELPVCEIKRSNEELAGLAGMRSGLPRSVYFSAIAVKEALDEIRQQLTPAVFEKLRVGFLSGNTVGGMDTSEHFYTDFLQDSTSGHLREVIHHECGAITELVAKHFKITGYVSTLSTACSSSTNAIMHGCRLIKHDKLDVVIAGGTDALCRFTLNGFNTLMILDNEPCKPFDENRKGLNLGEGAGYVVLVSDRLKNEHKLKTYAEVSGYANANDAFHQTASSAEGNGNYLAMNNALQMSGLMPQEIDHINAHGTGTGNNDSSEGIAIERLFSPKVPAVSSTKGNTGHTLGACGGIEAVYSCLSLEHQVIFPSLRVKTPMKEFSFLVNTTLLTGKEVNHVMSNSFGFGGNCSSVIFSKNKN